MRFASALRTDWGMKRDYRAGRRMISPGETAVVRQSALLGGLSEELTAELLQHSSIRNYDRGETVFLQGEPARRAFIVLEGWVKLFRITHGGAEAVVAVFTRGQSFAEAVAFQNVTYPVNAEAVTDCRLLRLDAPTMLDRMRTNPEIATAILSATYRHLHDLVAQVEQLKAQTGAQRVAEFLLNLCGSDSGACTVTMPYDKVLIAGRLGMKPESLSRAFTRLREAGVEVRSNHAVIADAAELRAFVNRDRSEFWRKAE